MDFNSIINDVNSKEDFTKFLTQLRLDKEQKSEEWENDEITSYLEGILSAAVSKANCKISLSSKACLVSRSREVVNTKFTKLYPPTPKQIATITIFQSKIL